MSRIISALAFFAPALVPVIAVACPERSASAAGASCGGPGSGYLTAIGLGIAIGLGSTALERMFAKRG